MNAPVNPPVCRCGTMKVVDGKVKFLPTSHHKPDCPLLLQSKKV